MADKTGEIARSIDHRESNARAQIMRGIKRGFEHMRDQSGLERYAHAACAFLAGVDCDLERHGACVTSRSLLG